MTLDWKISRHLVLACTSTCKVNDTFTAMTFTLDIVFNVIQTHFVMQEYDLYWTIMFQTGWQRSSASNSKFCKDSWEGWRDRRALL